MSEFRRLLERAADQVTFPDDPFDRVVRTRARRHRNRRVGAAVLALVVAAGGALGGWAALHGTGTSHTPAYIPGKASSSIPALWPETTVGALRRAEHHVAAGRDRWRLDPVATARRFAQDILGWPKVFVGSTSPPDKSRFPYGVELAPCDPSQNPDCFAGAEGLDVQRLRGANVFSVTGAFSHRLLVPLMPGTAVSPTFLERVDTNLPDRTPVLAASVALSDPPRFLAEHVAAVSHSVFHFCAQGALLHGACSVHPPSHTLAGYLAVLRPAQGVDVFHLFSPSRRTRLLIEDLTALPVRFATSGPFETCPNIRGTELFGDNAPRAAAATALRFSRALRVEGISKWRSFVDPSARERSDWPVTGDPARLKVLESQRASSDEIVLSGCGPDVATRSWRVTVSDGVVSTTHDFTLYLVRRSSGWLVWGAY